jgi:pimeloyl-ACP methyl ester carboxylesterase
MNVWMDYVRRRENALACQLNGVKLASDPMSGLAMLDPEAADDSFPALVKYVTGAINDADGFFELPNAIEFVRSGNIVTFASPIISQTSNDAVRARLFEARTRERAVVLLPHWNAAADQYRAFARALAACGITCLVLALPYHQHRTTPGIGFAREVVCENLGLTIRSNRQAIVEARACLTWLERQGYSKLGVIGVSLGSSLASIVAAMDARVRAAALILMADDFAEVVWTGSATTHVRVSLEQRFTLDEVRSAWAIISPATFAQRLSRRLGKLLIISTSLDTVFLPELTARYIERMSGHGLKPTWIRFGCGHYTLSLLPYSVPTLLHTLSYLKQTL